MLPKVKFTRYFHEMRKRPDRTFIRLEWIEQAVDHPIRQVTQQDGRFRRWASIATMGGQFFASCFYLTAKLSTTRFSTVPSNRESDMRIKYFQETDTLYIEFKPAPVVETRDFDENTQLDLDADGNITAMTVEHASSRADIPAFSYEQVAV